MQVRWNTRGAVVLSRGRSSIAAAISIAALALSVIGSQAATASPARDGDTAATTGAPPGLAASGGATAPRAALDHWTPARMRAARPPVLPGTADGAGVARRFGATALPAETADAAPATGRDKGKTDYVTPGQLNHYPHTAIGKVFFTLNGFDHVCSASAISTAGPWGEGSGNVVLTTGHCLNNGFGSFAVNFIFVPGYQGDGATLRDREPFGRWVASRLFTTDEWNWGFGSALARDVGFAKVQPPSDNGGRSLEDTVGAFGMAATDEPHPEHGVDVTVDPATTSRKLASFGYGVLNWGGQRMVQSLSRIARLDPNFTPNPVGISSRHTGGSSGGPWLVNYHGGLHAHHRNLVYGVNAYVYGGVDEMFSPQFDGLIARFRAFVSTQ